MLTISEIKNPRLREEFRDQLFKTIGNETNMKIIDYIARCRNVGSVVITNELINNNLQAFLDVNGIRNGHVNRVYPLKAGLTQAQLRGLEAIGTLVWNPKN